MTAAAETRVRDDGSGARGPSWSLPEVARLAEGRLAGTPGTRNAGHLSGPGEPADPGDEAGPRFDYRSISTDTRTLRAGDFFVALRGEQHDAHTYLAEVVERGACGALVDRPLADATMPQIVVDDSMIGWQRWGANHLRAWRHASAARALVAITGSSGKTTTKDLLAHMLAGAAPVWSTEGNRNNHVGVPWTLLGLGETHRFAVVELGMNHAGEISVLSRLSTPDVAVLTGVGRAHVGHLGSREGILRAKLEILEGLPPDAPFVLPHDPWILERLPDTARARRRLSFGMDRGADWHPLETPRLSLEGARFRTARAGEVSVSLLGEGAVLSALGALAAVEALGLDARALAPRLASAPPRALRMELRRSPGGVEWLLDCYNASPESTQLALRFVRELEHRGRRILVLGELGELGAASEEIHRELGASARGFDLAVFLGPATRASMEALQEAGGTYPSVWLPNLEAASAYLAAGLQSGDLVLLKASRRWALERILEQVPPSLSPARASQEG